MKFTYRLVKDASGWTAECIESEAAGEGKTSQAAVESLRSALEERMLRPDAVAPPSEAEHEAIELTLASEQPDRRSLDLGGPGEPPRPHR